jgi:hypothetical protein
LARFNQRTLPLNQTFHNVSIYYLLKALESRGKYTPNFLEILENRSFNVVEIQRGRTTATLTKGGVFLSNFKRTPASVLPTFCPKPFF